MRLFEGLLYEIKSFLDSFITSSKALKGKFLDNFLKWLSKNNPDETEYLLLKNTDGLFEKRIKEYRLRKN